jgi:maltose alpha-D-glucosyltransferase/alpha-amylase
MPSLTVDAALTDPLWYKDAIIYQLHVKAFADSNEDGIGDLAGLTERLDYLTDLGVTALWLLPFYPSPGRDDGYDIADYRRINPAFGSLKDFRRFMLEAKRRNIRVITELVINHTSDQHPWFKRARRSKPGSSARDWYVWSDTDQRYLGTRIIFTDTEKSNWAWDPEAGAYYWHRFFSHQPDLNYDNPRVFWAIIQVMKRWLDMGVDGFRLDAIPYLCEREGTNNENLFETHAIIKKLRAEVEDYAPGTLLLAEANQWPEDVSAYFGNGDECHMAYHFPLMPRIYMAIAQEDRFPITDILRQTPDIPENCQWALFLRNHDELTLEMVTDSERDYLWSTYAADPRARVNLGIRRRLAPLMDNDRRKIELMKSLLMSLPGTPIIYYGDEIGMGDNIYLGDRNGVRTPMQWTPDRNGGFSRCDPAKLYLPPIMDAVYGYQAVNVEAQSRSLSSLLSWTKRIIAVRKSSQVFGRGSLSFIRPSNRAVLVYVREYRGEAILCVANLSRSAQAAEIDLSPWRGRVPLEMLGRSRFGRIGDAPFVVTLAPYGFFWFLLCDEEGAGPELQTFGPELTTLVFSTGLKSLEEPRTKYLFEREALPMFLRSRRWFANKDSASFDARLDTLLPLGADSAAMLALITVDSDGAKSRYLLPLAINWASMDRRGGPLVANVLAPIRRGAREGMLVDAAPDRDFVARLLAQIHAAARASVDGRELEFQPTGLFAQSPLPQISNVKASTAEQSNSTVMVEPVGVLKIYRRLRPGTNPEVEIGRFLTDVARFPQTPPLLGAVELVENGTRTALAVLHGFVENQGDGWAYASAHLDRFLEEQRLLAPEAPTDESAHASFMQRIRQMGKGVGELHLALASRPDIEAFAPEPITADDAAHWTARLVASANRIFDQLGQRRAELKEDGRALADALLAQRAAVIERLTSLLPQAIAGQKIRHHGDLHLGQILIVKDGISILDFEGEPGRDNEERRRKAPAARDLAGFLRSLDYAALAALDRTVKASPEEHAKLARALEIWREEATSAFLQSYREAAGGNALWPTEPELSERLLQFFVIEKAIYEIGYELANRPAWLHVPLAGALRLLVGTAETTA